MISPALRSEVPPHQKDIINMQSIKQEPLKREVNFQ